VHVPEVTVYSGSPEKPVQLEEVRHWCDLQMGRYPNAILVFDPYQTLHLIQQYEAAGKEVRRFEFRSGRNNQLFAENLRTLMTNRKIVFSLFTGLVGGSTLLDEFKSVIAKQKIYGTRIDHRHNEHDDRVCAVGLAALCAVQESEPGPVPQKGIATDEPTPRSGGYSEKHQWDRPFAAQRGLFGLQPPSAY
jgi:hypothetical protein